MLLPHARTKRGITLGRRKQKSSPICRATGRTQGAGCRMPPTRATYASGHLVFLRRGTLFAVPFDVDRLEIRGTPDAGAPDGGAGADRGPRGGRDRVQASSLSRRPACSRGCAPQVVHIPPGPLVTVDRNGNVAALPESAEPYSGPRYVSLLTVVRLAVVGADPRRRWASGSTTWDGTTLTPLNRGRALSVGASGGLRTDADSSSGQFKGGQWTLVRAACGRQCASAMCCCLARRAPVAPVSFTPDGRQLVGVTGCETSWW